MAKVDLGDVTIHYEERGSGPLAYVFCHGGGGTGQVFVEHFPFWIQHFPRVITWDNRGMGQSSQAAKYSLPSYASDLAGLLRQLGVHRAVLHGVSWGGVVVQQFAIDYPDMCAAIIVDSSSSEVNVTASENWYKRGELARLGENADLGKFRPAFAGHTASAQAIRRDGTEVRPENIDSYVAMMRALAGLREHPLTPRLGEIRCPALVVGAGRDATAGAGGSVIMARNIANARLEIFQEAKHAVYRHNKDEFRKLVLEFCYDNNILTM